MAGAAIASTIGGALANIATGLTTNVGTAAYQQSLFKQNRQHIEDVVTSEGLPKALLYIPSSGASNVHNYLGKGTYRDTSMLASGNGVPNTYYPTMFNVLKNRADKPEYKPTKPTDPPPTKSFRAVGVNTINEIAPISSSNFSVQTTPTTNFSVQSHLSPADRAMLATPDPALASRSVIKPTMFVHGSGSADISNRWRSVNKYK